MVLNLFVLNIRARSTLSKVHAEMTSNISYILHQISISFNLGRLKIGSYNHLPLFDGMECKLSTKQRSNYFTYLHHFFLTATHGLGVQHQLNIVRPDDYRISCEFIFNKAHAKNCSPM